MYPPPLKLLFRPSKTAYPNFALEMCSNCYCGVTNNNLEVKFSMMATIFQDGRQMIANYQYSNK